MANKNEETEAATLSWWDWAMDAKDMVISQSTEVLDYVTKDVNEFTQEASSVVQSTATAIKEKLQLDDNLSTNDIKKSVSGFINQMSEAFSPPPDDSGEETIVICNQEPVLIKNRKCSKIPCRRKHIFYDKKKVESTGHVYERENIRKYLHIYKIQKTTFPSPFEIKDHRANQVGKYDKKIKAISFATCSDPYNFLKTCDCDDTPFQNWFKDFNMEDYGDKEDTVLRSDVSIREIFELIVPDQTSRKHFWGRYFYKKHVDELIDALDDDERIDPEESGKNKIWDEDETFGGDVDLPEHLQSKLLEDYEKECQKSIDPTISEKESLRNDVDGGDLNKGSDSKGMESGSPASSKDTDDSWDKLQSLEADLVGTNSSEKTKEDSDAKSEDWEDWE